MRASYRKGVEWIALNDEPEDLDTYSVAGYISTSLLADLFGKRENEVAAAIVRKRRQWLREEGARVETRAAARQRALQSLWQSYPDGVTTSPDA